MLRSIDANPLIPPVSCLLSSQFGSHAHALAVLREMDGSGRYREIAHDGRPIVEFTIENIRKVRNRPLPLPLLLLIIIPPSLPFPSPMLCYS